jgi:transposase
MRLPISVRAALVKGYRQVKNKSLLVKIFGVSRQTVAYWCKRASHRGREYFKDKPRKPKHAKITPNIEDFILFLRVVFEWGTARIQQGLLSMPSFMYQELPYEIRNVRGVHLSRAAINNVLKKHKRNGYHSQVEKWKFFRAKQPNELWQLDIKGPVIVNGKRYWFVVCIDDYSRYILVLKQLDHCPTTKEIISMIFPFVKRHKPKSILTDHGRQFSDEWKHFCKHNNIEPLFAHLRYPQDKGKIERAIRNIAEEFTNLLKKFPNWLNGQIEKFRRWYNNCRFHHGIGAVPRQLYVLS